MAFLERNANRGSVSTGFNIENSLKVEKENSEYLKAEGRGQGNQKTWTWSCWVKRSYINSGQVAQYIMSAGSDGKLGMYFRDDSSSTGGDTIFLYVDDGNSLKWIGEVRRSFRDTSAWYHIVLAVDSTDGTPADRTKIYVNGEQQTITYNATLNQNSNTRIGDSGGKLSIGAKMDGDYEFSGYMAEIALVDGSQLAPTSFGEFDEDSGIWKPISLSTLNLGTQGFHMNFDDASNLGKVKTGTSQGNFDLTNITAADQATDTPTNNFATINGMAGLGQGGTPFKFRNGSTEIWRDPDDSGGWTCVVSTMAVNKGKWYAEFEVLESPSVTMYGYTTVAYLAEGGSGLNHPQFYLGNSPNSTGYYSNGDGANDSIYEDVSYPSTGVQSSAGTVISVALDCDNNKIHFANNGTYTNSSNPVNNTNGFAVVDDYVYFAHASYAGNKTYKTNLGGYTSDTPSSAASDANGYGTFEYAPPAGYYALCTKNLAEYG